MAQWLGTLAALPNVQFPALPGQFTTAHNSSLEGSDTLIQTYVEAEHQCKYKLRLCHSKSSTLHTYSGCIVFRYIHNPNSADLPGGRHLAYFYILLFMDITAMMLDEILCGYWSTFLDRLPRVEILCQMVLRVELPHSFLNSVR